MASACSAAPPYFTAAVLTSLSLGIGATTAIFSLVDTLILRPLPVRDPHQLVELLSQYPGDPPMNGFSWRHYDVEPLEALRRV